MTSPPESWAKAAGGDSSAITANAATSPSVRNRPVCGSLCKNQRVNVENIKAFLNIHYSLNRLRLTVGRCLVVHVFYIMLARLRRAFSYQPSAVRGYEEVDSWLLWRKSPQPPFTKGGL